ncbi:MAG: hypothetical protein ACF8GE_09950 [Phycisphaerales bacterium JB043]
MARSARIGMTLMALVLPVALASCGDESATSQAIRSARHQLTALHAGAVSPQDRQMRRGKYEDTIRSLRAVSGQGTDSEQASAAMLLGTAQASLAQLLASRTIDMEHDAVSRLGLIRARFDHLVVSMQSGAQSMTSVDSTSEQRSIERDRQTLQSELEIVSASVDAFNTQITQWRQEMDEAVESAATFRQQEGQLRTQMLQVTGQQRAELTIAAVDAQRSADAFDLKAANASSQIALLEPQKQQLEQDVVRIQTQLDNLAQTRQQMQASDTIRQQAAGEAMRIAQDAAQQIAQDLVALDTYRTTDIANAYDETFSNLDGALAALRNASRDNELRTTASLTIGGVLQSKSELLSRRLASMRQYAQTLEAIVDPEFAVPNASQFSAYVSRVHTNIAQMEQDLQDAVQEAIDTYERVRVSGEAQARLQSLVAQLRESLPPTDSPDS